MKIILLLATLMLTQSVFSSQLSLREKVEAKGLWLQLHHLTTGDVARDDVTVRVEVSGVDSHKKVGGWFLDLGDQEKNSDSRPLGMNLLVSPEEIKEEFSSLLADESIFIDIVVTSRRFNPIYNLRGYETLYKMGDFGQVKSFHFPRRSRQGLFLLTYSLSTNDNVL